MDPVHPEPGDHASGGAPQRSGRSVPKAALLYDRVGGEDGLRTLVETFYDIIEFEPEGRGLYILHLRGHGVAHSRIEQFNFLCGFMGGRAHYREKHGHMDVRLMHAHVPINLQDAEDWLALMDRALARCGHREGAHVERLRATFRRVALHLVNDLGEWGIRRGTPA